MKMDIILNLRIILNKNIAKLFKTLLKYIKNIYYIRIMFILNRFQSHLQFLRLLIVGIKLQIMMTYHSKYFF